MTWKAATMTVSSSAGTACCCTSGGLRLRAAGDRRRGCCLPAGWHSGYTSAPRPSPVQARGPDVHCLCGPRQPRGRSADRRHYRLPAAVGAAVEHRHGLFAAGAARGQRRRCMDGCGARSSRSCQSLPLGWIAIHLPPCTLCSRWRRGWAWPLASISRSTAGSSTHRGCATPCGSWLSWQSLDQTCRRWVGGWVRWVGGRLDGWVLDERSCQSESGCCGCLPCWVGLATSRLSDPAPRQLPPSCCLAAPLPAPSPAHQGCCPWSPARR